MIIRVASGFIIYNCMNRISVLSKSIKSFCFLLEANTAVFHLTEISHFPLHIHILGTFPLYLQKIANLFSV